MNAGLNLLTALFLLAPGFGAFAGVYLTGLRRPFRPAPAPPGSLLALALVTIGALGAHVISAVPFAIQDAACSQLTCWSAPFQPNPYLTLMDPRGQPGLTGVSLMIALAHLLMVAFVGLLIGRLGMWFAVRFGQVQSLFYGWTTELIDRAPTRFHVINAFAVTDIADGGLSLGYEGTLLDLRQDPAGKLLSATLRDVQAFVMKLEDETVRRKRVKRSQPIPFIVLEAENIKNLALSIYFDTKAATALTEAEIRGMSASERDAITRALKAAQHAKAPATTEEDKPVRRQNPPAGARRSSRPPRRPSSPARERD